MGKSRLSLFSVDSRGRLMCIIYKYCLYFQKPIISCSDAMHSFLEAHCPIFSEKFWPTVWCIEARAQTIIFSVFAKRPHVPYER